MAFRRRRYVVHLPRQTPTPSGVESPSPGVPSPTDSPLPTGSTPVEGGNASSGAGSSSPGPGASTPPAVTEPTGSPTEPSSPPNQPPSPPPSSNPPRSSDPQPPSSPPPSPPPSSPPPSPPPSSPPPSSPPPSPPPSSPPPSSPPSSDPTSPPTSEPTPPPSSPPSSQPSPPSSDPPPPSSSSSQPPVSAETTPPTTTSHEPISAPPSQFATSFTTTQIVTSVGGQLTTITTQTPLPTNLWSSTPSPSRSSTSALIAGVTVGAVVLISVIIGGIFAYRRHQRNRAIFGFVEKLIARQKHQQGRARLLEGEEFEDDDHIAMTPYTDRDGTHSRGSSLAAMTPMSVHSRGMSAANAFGVLDPSGGRGTPTSNASAPPTPSPVPSLFRARASESGSIFREEGVWPPPGETSRMVDPFAKGMGAGEGLLGSSATEYTGIPAAAGVAAAVAGVASTSTTTTAPAASQASTSKQQVSGSSTPPPTPFAAILANAGIRSETPPPSYRPSPLSTSDTAPTLSSGLPPLNMTPSLSALIAAVETPLKAPMSSTLNGSAAGGSSQPTNTSPPSSPPASPRLPPGAAPPRAPSALAISNPDIDPDEMVLPVLGSASSSPSVSPTLGQNQRSERRMSRISFSGDGSPKNWLERAVHPPPKS